MNEVDSRNNVSIVRFRGSPVESLPLEIVERKGQGHPDSLCDGIAEKISQRYSEYCLRRFGFVLHHNFDKVQLVAGKANPKFGGGTIEKPVRVQIAGRGTPECSGEAIPVDDIAVKAARTHLEDTLRYAGKGEFVIESYVGRGSCDLTELYARYSGGKETPFANDTSFGFCHWPFSTLEKTVLCAEKYVNGDLRDEFKQIGEDVKVFGVREGKRIDLTVAIAIVDAEVKDIHQYVKLKDELQDRIEDFLCSNIPLRKIDIHINCADNIKNNSVYLTVTGTSGENGDDGSVGRGNRLNGLITPFRGMSLEAVAGKNPISHIGKVYNVLSILTAQKLVKEIGEVEECSVLFSARIGDPIDKPRIAHVTILPRKGVHLADIRHLVESSVEDTVSKVTIISNKIVTDGLHFVEDLLCPSQ